MDSTQNICVIGSKTDSLYIKLGTDFEMDIDQVFSLKALKEIKFDEESQLFYVIANSYKDKLGLFIIKLAVNDPY